MHPFFAVVEISKKLFVVEYCDWSLFKDDLLDYVFLEFHWSREKRPNEIVQLRKTIFFHLNLFYF